MPLALRDLQRAFAAHLSGEDQPAVVAEIVPAATRLRIHRHHVLDSLASALATTFPTVQAVVGADFFRGLAHAFVGQSLPSQPVLAEYGAGFPAFIAGHDAIRDLPYLADVARLDWALNLAFHAPAGGRLSAADLAAGGVRLLVLRRPDDAAFVTLSAGEAAFVTGLGEGLSLEEAVGRAETDFDLSTCFARLLGWGVFAAAQ